MRQKKQLDCQAQGIRVVLTLHRPKNQLIRVHGSFAGAFTIAGEHRVLQRDFELTVGHPAQKLLLRHLDVAAAGFSHRHIVF